MELYIKSLLANKVALVVVKRTVAQSNFQVLFFEFSTVHGISRLNLLTSIEVHGGSHHSLFLQIIFINRPLLPSRRKWNWFLSVNGSLSLPACATSLRWLGMSERCLSSPGKSNFSLAYIYRSPSIFFLCGVCRLIPFKIIKLSFPSA